MELTERQPGWIELQVEACAPPEVIVPRGLAQPIAALAAAAHAIEQRQGRVFGMPVAVRDHGSLAKLAMRCRELLASWRDRLVAEHGEEGARFVASIAARRGITFPAARSPA